MAATAVRRQLERRGYAVCLRDADIPPVKDAVHPITTARICILLVSPGAYRSRRVRHELAQAKAAQVPLIPFLIRPLSPEIPISGSYINGVDDPKAGFQQVLARVEHYLQHEVKTQRKPAAAPTRAGLSLRWRIPAAMLALILVLVLGLSARHFTNDISPEASKPIRTLPARTVATDSTEVPGLTDPTDSTDTIDSRATNTAISVAQAEITGTPIPNETESLSSGFSAMFSAFPTSGNAPLTVEFTNESSGDIVAYAWDFDDDGVIDSTLENPDWFVFEQSGIFYVRLTITNADGETQSGSLAIIVYAADGSSTLHAPVASFSASPMFGDAPLTVNFSNLSSGNITHYAWDFDGDGLSDSIDANPQPFTYRTAGMYAASLIVAGPDGISLPESITIIVNAPPPPPPGTDTPEPPDGGVTADFSASPTTGSIPLSVTFTNRSKGNIVQYAWDFDGDTQIDSSLANPPAYTYTFPAIYTATLTVTGDDGTTSTKTTTIIAQSSHSGNDNAPVANFDANPTWGQAPLSVTFTNMTIGDDITGYAWDFNGDGTTDSTAANPQPYTFTRAGTYEASLTVSGAGGVSEPAILEIVVTEADNTGLIASFSANPTVGSAPLTVSFTNESFGDITGYAWDFDGDGTTDSTAANPPPFTYTEEGLYEASLVVSGPGGESLPEVMMIAVNPSQGDALTALFSATPKTGAAPLTVTFNNQSSGDIQSYAWDFDGGGTIDSTNRNPGTFVYHTPGTYTATLTITGLSTTKTHTETITVTGDAANLAAHFTVSRANGTAPLAITFTNTSTGQITGYAWDFNGDGTTDSTAANPPAYTYNQPGTYIVSLTVTGASGQTQSATQVVTVDASAPPVAAFTANPTSGTAPLVVTFTNTSSGQITGYAWDLNGDGTTDSTAANPPAYTYTTAGTYTARLRVTGPGGTSDPATFIITVSTAQPPVAAFTANPTNGTAPLVVTFTNTSSGQITGYAWDLNGDGVVDSTAANPPAYTYSAAGTYTARLRVTGPGGTSTPAAVTITVTAPIQPPTAAFTANPTSGTVPLVVTFTNTSSGQITSYAWDLNGDGVVDSTTANPPAYTYASAGNYTVTLTVSGPGGTSTPTTAVIMAETPPPTPPTAAFTANPTSGTAPLIVTFTNTSSGQITSYAWDFNGDGVTDSTEANPPANTYTDAGNYTATLTVTGPGGTSAPAMAAIMVDAPPPTPPTAAFTANPTSGTAPLVVTFTNTSSGQITSYAWDLNGDGLIDSTEANPPAYTYTNAGNYIVTLTVTGPGGTSAPMTAVIMAETPLPPIAAFTASPTSGTTPLVVTFTNTSSGQITSYAWDLNGDGVVDSTEANPPAYTYTNAGNYTVTLTVSGPGGTSAPAAAFVIADLPPPESTAQP